MNPASPSPPEIVACVLESWQVNLSHDATVQRLVERGLGREEAADVVELVRSGIARAALLSAGLPANQISSDVDDHPIFLAAVKAGRLKILESPVEPIPELASLLANLYGEDASLRRTAAYELARSKKRDPLVTAALLTALDDPDTYVRVYAIQSLATLKAKKAIAPCSALLRSDAPAIVLINAIKALAEIGDPLAVPALIEATRHENAFVRHDAAWALGEFDDAAAGPALEALLNDATVPVERDELGLTSKTSIYSVSDQARRSLDKIQARSKPLLRSHSFVVALTLTATLFGIPALALTMYNYFVHGVASILGIAVCAVALVVGLIGLTYSLVDGDREL